MRPLRLLPSGVPHLPPARSRDRFAPRPYPSPPSADGGPGGGDAVAGEPSGPLPPVPGLRDGLSLQRPLRPHHGVGSGDAGAAGTGAAGLARAGLGAAPALPLPETPTTALLPPASLSALRPPAPPACEPIAAAHTRRSSRSGVDAAGSASTALRADGGAGRRSGGPSRRAADGLHNAAAVRSHARSDGARARPSRRPGRRARRSALLRRP